ncbi:MAG: discoidin domain-containing protein [Candidatus Aenigmarchaeota archaeon]|nr:discoidin domain-containing protein [Candidatus Aenigmarchaeota archaeon]
MLRLHHALLAISIVVLASSLASAQGIEDIEDLKFQGINCFIDGKQLDPVQDKSLFQELDKLWNPVQEAQQLPSRGPRIKFEWDSEGSKSLFSCEFVFESIQPWRAAAIESKRDIERIAFRIEEESGRVHTYLLDNVQKLRNRRITSPDYIGAKKISIEMVVPCENQTERQICKLDVEEITPFARVPEITYGAKDRAVPFGILPAFLPGESVLLAGNVDLRSFVCLGNRYYCSWSASADCACTKKVLGACVDKDCKYDRCPSTGEYFENKLFYDVQRFDSGRCSAFLEKYFPQIIGIGLTIWAIALTAGAAAPLVGALEVTAIGAATAAGTAAIASTLYVVGAVFMAYNPQISFSDQWFNIALAAATAATAGTPQFDSFSQAILWVGVTTAAGYAANWIVEELDLQFSGIIGSIIGSAIQSAITTAVQRAALAGVAHSFDIDSGPFAEIREMSVGEFVRLGTGDMTEIWREIVRASITSAVTNLAAREICDSFEGAEQSVCQIAAARASSFLTNWLEPHLTGALNNEMQTEIRTVGELTREQIEGLKVASELYAEKGQAMSFGEFLRQDETEIIIDETLGGEFIPLTSDQITRIEGIYGSSPPNFLNRIEALSASHQILQLERSTSSLLFSVQRAVSTAMQGEETAEELARQLEMSLKLARCACYGQVSLRMDPQFLNEPVECESFSYANKNTISVKVPEIGPSGVPESGFGWCRAPIEFYSRKQEGGIVTGILLKDGSVNGMAEGPIDEQGNFLVSGINLPSQPGSYIINVTSTTGATSALFESMEGTIRTVESLPGFPDSLVFAINLVSATHQRLLDANLQDHAKLVEGMKGIAEEIAVYNMPLTDRNKFSEGMKEIDSLISGLNNLEGRANAHNHITTLEIFERDLENTKNSLQSASSRNSMITLAGISAAANLTRFRVQMDNVESSFYNPRVRNAEEKIRNINLYLTAGDFPYIWYEVERCQYGFVFISGNCYTTASVFKVIAGHEEDPGASVQELEDIQIEYTGKRNNKGVYVNDEGTYAANIRLVDSINDFSILSAGIIEYLRSGNALEVQWGDEFSPDFINNMENMRKFSEEMNRRSSEILTNLYQLYGRCSHYSSATGECDEIAPIYNAPGEYKIANKNSRKNLGKALVGAHVLGNVSAMARDFYNLSGDAAWHAKLNNYPGKDELDKKLLELKNTIDEMVTAAIERRADDIASATTAARQRLQELKDLTSDALMHAVEKRVDVMETSFSVQLEPQQICGAGNPFTINATVKAKSYWPVIPVEAGVWTPFSVPYVPRQKTTLADIAPQCKAKEIAWLEPGGDMRVNNPLSVEIKPGRGYYLLSQNSCEIKIDLSLFKNDADIVVSDEEARITSDDVNFFGSSSRTIPLSPGSLGHVENEVQLPILHLSGNIYATHRCKPARYEVYKDFYRERPVKNWTEFRRALPAPAYPFSDSFDDTRLVSEPADIMEPGNAYFAWTSAGECNLSSLPASLPTSVEIGTKGILLNATYELPEGWKIRDDELSGIWSFNTLPLCNGTTGQYCAGIGDNTTFYRRLTPRITAPGKQKLAFIFADEATEKKVRAETEYNLVSPKPALSVRKTKEKNFVIYDADISSNLPQVCGEHDFAVRAETPMGWNIQANESVTMAAFKIVKERVSLSPVPGEAQSGYFNLMVFSELPEFERLLAGDIPDLSSSCNPAALIENALDLDSNGTHIFYSTGFSINSISKSSCSKNQMVSGSGIKGIEEDNGRLLWIEGTDLKTLEIKSGAVNTLTTVNEDSFFLAADDNEIYWAEDDKIIKWSSAGTAILAESLDNPLGVYAENGDVYWTEPKVVRRTSSFCSKDNCAIAVEIDESLITESGRLSAVEVNGNEMFLSVINPNALSASAPRDVGKIIRVGSSKEVIAKPLQLVLETGISSIAVDGEYVYFVRSMGMMDGGFVDRVSRFVQSSTYSEFLEVPGRSPPTVTIYPKERNASSGTIAVFDINITNTNTQEALEPEQFFRIVEFEADDKLLLCAPDVLAFGFFECEDSGFSREDILRFVYGEPFAGVNLGPGETGSVQLAVKLADDLTEIGKELGFTAYVAGIDSGNPMPVSAKVVSDIPGPPVIRITPIHSHCGTLDAGFVNRECTSSYILEIENPEQVPVQYDLSLISPDPENNWMTSLDRKRITVDGIYGFNRAFATISISAKPLTPYGAYAFVVRAQNLLFPGKFSEKPLVLVLTPDDGDGLCEPGLGETPDNTKDCRSDFFTCTFSGKCDTTTPNGVLFSSITSEEIETFAVCNAKTVGGSGFASCKYYADKGGTNILCSSSDKTSIPSCSYRCTDESDNYMLLAKMDEEWKRSPAFTYSCPECLGKIQSKLIKTDTFFTALLFPEYSDGVVPFETWADYIAGEHMRADAFNAAACISLVSDAYSKARNIIEEREKAGEKIFPVGGLCAELRIKAQELVEKTDDLIWQVCRNGLDASLLADRLGIRDLSSGNTKAFLNVTNGNLKKNQARMSCNYESSGKSYVALSACESLEPGQKKELTAALRNATEGFWNVQCSLAWSPYDSCDVVVPVKEFFDAFDISRSEPYADIAYALLPEFAYAGEESAIEIITSNSGGAANLRARCTGTFDNGDIIFESGVTSFNPGSINSLLAKYTPDREGELIIRECSLFVVGSSGAEALADFEAVDGVIPVWSLCSLQCQRKGFSYGIEESGSCECGKLSFSGISCRRTSAEGSNGIYNASVKVSWDIGEKILVEDTYYGQPVFTHSEEFAGIGVHNISASIVSGGKEIYKQKTSVACFAAPLVEIISPEEGGRINSDFEITLRVADADSSSVYLNGRFLGEYEIPDSGLISIPVPMSRLQEGENEIAADACNNLCTTESRSFTASLDGFSGFILDPATASYNAVAGSRLGIKMKIINGDKAVFLSSNITSEWPAAMVIKGQNSARLDAEEKSDAVLGVSIPSDAELGDTKEIFVTLKGNSITKIFGPYAITVSNREASAPLVLSLYHQPGRGVEGQPVTFYADVISEHPLTRLSVCKNTDCTEVWCDMPLDSHSCSAMVVKGTHNYKLIARNSPGLQSITSERTFVVGEKDDLCEILSGELRAESMPNSPVTNAADNDINTYWTSRRGLPQPVAMEIGQAEGVGGLELFSESPSRPKAFRVETSEDCSLFSSAYEDFDAGRGEERFGKSGIYSASFNAKNARCVRLVAIESENKADYISLAEVSFCKGTMHAESNETAPIEPTAGEPKKDNALLIIGIAVIIILAAVFFIANQLNKQHRKIGLLYGKAQMACSVSFVVSLYNPQ